MARQFFVRNLRSFGILFPGPILRWRTQNYKYEDIGEDATQYQVTSDLPVYWVAIKAIESLDGLSISFRERRWQDRRHQQAAKKCLSCDLHKMPLKGYLPIYA